MFSQDMQPDDVTKRVQSLLNGEKLYKNLTILAVSKQVNEASYKNYIK